MEQSSRIPQHTWIIWIFVLATIYPAVCLADPCGFYLPVNQHVCECYPNLARIDCIHRGLKFIPKFSLKIGKFYSLDLRRNLITTVSKKDLNALKGFKKINLRENPLNCTKLPYWQYLVSDCSNNARNFTDLLLTTQTIETAPNDPIKSINLSWILTTTMLSIICAILFFWLVWLKLLKTKILGRYQILEINESDLELIQFSDSENSQENDSTRTPIRQGSSPSSNATTMFSTPDISSTESTSTLIKTPDLYSPEGSSSIVSTVKSLRSPDSYMSTVAETVNDSSIPTTDSFTGKTRAEINQDTDDGSIATVTGVASEDNLSQHNSSGDSRDERIAPKNGEHSPANSDGVDGFSPIQRYNLRPNPRRNSKTDFHYY